MLLNSGSVKSVLCYSSQTSRSQRVKLKGKFVSPLMKRRRSREEDDEEDAIRRRKARELRVVGPKVEDYKRGIRLSVSVSRQLIAISKQIIGAANLNVAPTTQQASLVTIYIVSTETRVRARRSLSLSACGTSSSRARRVALRIISLRH
ncbi:hypothetical protein HZH68_010545 [Vespula germanica]|uniref:Uncharacterized protein n=1 Tax=Vespula germanica TaxID=30212 RepID=A0A834JSN1_VESGE|nr:hypothetical protein HZH68_010545 [Vespula germanica]